MIIKLHLGSRDLHLSGQDTHLSAQDLHLGGQDKLRLYKENISLKIKIYFTLSLSDSGF